MAMATIRKPLLLYYQSDCCYETINLGNFVILVNSDDLRGREIKKVIILKKQTKSNLRMGWSQHNTSSGVNEFSKFRSGACSP